MKNNRDDYILQSSEKDFFNALRNSKIIQSAEAFYRKMIYRDERSWNARAQNFKNTAVELVEFYDGAGLIGWAHNTHMGDARYTDMRAQNRKNIGQMLKENYSEDVHILGFGTYRGKVAAGRQWGTDIEIMTVPPSPANTLEHAMYGVSENEEALFIMDHIKNYDVTHQPLEHRAIGVVYNPETEYPGNYVQTILPGRYDSFIFIPESESVRPLVF